MPSHSSRSVDINQVYCRNLLASLKEQTKQAVSSTMNSRKQDKDSKETELQNIRHDHYGVFVHNYAKYEDPDDDNKEDGSGGKKADSAAVFSSDPSAAGASAGGGEGKFRTASGSTENNMEAIQNLLEENVWHGLVTIAIYMGVDVLAYSYVFENWR